VKTWCDDETEYATLYTDDYLYKYERPLHEFKDMTGEQRRLMYQGGWEQRNVAGESWPLRNPLGVVPMGEVRNRGPLRGDPLSEIASVAPMQDAINLLWAYLFAAADYASFPARVVLGMEQPKVPKFDDNGDIVGYTPIDIESLAEGRMLFLQQPGTDPKIGQWDAAKLDVFTEVVEIAVGHVAAQTRTPQHYLILGRNANPAAAEALTAAEAGLTAKVNDLQLFMSSDVREVFRLMALARGDRALAELAAAGTVVWEDSENKSEAQKADAANKWASIGLDKRTVLARYWTSNPAELDKIMARVEAEQDDPTMRRLMRDLERVPAPGADAEPTSV